MTRKTELFREGLSFFETDETSYAHEFDFNGDELLELSGIQKCPKCGAPVDCDDGVIHCTKCDWVLYF